ncbi:MULTISPECIES: metal ABC transporter ATP-binding protein [unclassified Rathayibacter]|uniref:metal ABC transporter ATP-binding protein n=1 Tax=unclassified Rathayibacter TaxID=2609250 RepID=UPI0006F31C47|nr:MULTISPECIES: ATP-binding cassette domain-containing protein [unclassified Rathayibacter]KQQ05681.1 ABC transporter ATP-binding protein [Rathayibacter sp. Leaf294]KQS13539.1 ABC transporter ATP-binding protein [Rathayibacter sp. Leaf185]
MTPTDPTAGPASSEAGPSVLQLRGAGLRFGDRELWSGVDLDVQAGEFVAVLGANGSGKTSLLKAVLGQQALSEGELRVLGAPVHRGNRRIGYIPQQKLADDGTPLRARDLIGLGIDGHRFGLPLPSRSRRAQVDALLESVGAIEFGDAPIGSLSGGEQQRVRVGQALAGDPALLLCDEPLIALDLAHQRAVSELIDRHRRERDLGVLFVTHDVNPVLGMVDRVLYLAGGRFRVGTPDEVLRSEVLSELYDAPVDVIRARGRVIVVGAPDHSHVHEHEHGHEHREERA